MDILDLLSYIDELSRERVIVAVLDVGVDTKHVSEWDFLRGTKLTRDPNIRRVPIIFVIIDLLDAPQYPRHTLHIGPRAPSSSDRVEMIVQSLQYRVDMLLSTEYLSVV